MTLDHCLKTLNVLLPPNFMLHLIILKLHFFQNKNLKNYIYIYMHAYIYLYMHSVYVCVCVYMCMCACLCTHMCVCVCVFLIVSSYPIN